MCIEKEVSVFILVCRKKKEKENLTRPECGLSQVLLMNKPYILGWVRSVYGFEGKPTWPGPITPLIYFIKLWIFLAIHQLHLISKIMNFLSSSAFFFSIFLTSLFVWPFFVSTKSYRYIIFMFYWTFFAYFN